MMAEPTMPAEVWMFWATSDGSSRWLVAIDECSGADDLYLVATSEETAKRVAKEQAETYFDGQEESVIPVRIKPTPEQPKPWTEDQIEYFEAQQEADFYSRNSIMADHLKSLEQKAFGEKGDGA